MDNQIWFVNEEVWYEQLLKYCANKEEQKVIHDVFVRARDQVPRNERCDIDSTLPIQPF